MKIEITLSNNEVNAIEKVQDTFAKKLGQAKTDILGNGTYYSATKEIKFVHEYASGLIIDCCEMAEALSDKVVAIANAAKSFILLFKDFNADFAKKLADLKNKHGIM